ncbi:1-acyl-sn-glycerol-3-phosphate acyltransferase gamma-like isoform X2 [Anthonomus grandis grandis]|uniref:1-acyl-sn-glycerol-3-phosphate acyltransferase gamma-like isoform X2 n=1 Tax=Anthonomus grandis grandis TaxID=2921223 RepID=UPI00216684E9|nr:1-acyl-sn-glycerol-3-phosphate acyltransferase gamma-like isoform X2 [Anthonomus grandis grandis]
MDLKMLKQSRTVHLCFAMTFFTSGIVVNLIQAIFYFGLRPFNKTLYRRINWYLCYTIYSQLVCLAEWWANVKLILYIDKNDWNKYFGKEHGYCIMNHSYEIDWLMGWMACEKMTVLGNCKAYAKKVIQYIPVLGWGWKFAEFVFLERSYEKDKEVINKQIKELADHPDPMWLLLFPEGTRFTPNKHETSLKYARENNLPELKHHLLPRTKGFIASLPSMRGKIPAIYDTVVVFKEDDPVAPTITNLLFGKSVTAHMYIKRVPLEEVPHTEPEQEKYLRQMFLRKDKMKESFLQTGDFFKNSGIAAVEPWVPERRIWPALNVIFWLVSILVPMLYYLIKLFFSGQIIYFTIGTGLIFTFYVLLQRTIAMSETKHGSSYGTKIDSHSKPE